MKIIVEGIYLEITSKCNLKCPHCYNNSGEANDEFPIFLLKRMMHSFKKMGGNYVNISGGEPLASDNFINILSELNNYNGVSIGITSNGTLLSQNIIDNIKNVYKKPLFFQISVDGATSKSNDFIRGDGSFKKILKGVDILKNNNISFKFHTLCHKKNKNNLLDIISFSKNMGAFEVDLVFLNFKGRGAINYRDIALTNAEQYSIIDEIDNIKKQNVLDGYKINAPSVFYGYCPIFSDSEEEIKLFLRIDSKGNVFVCQTFDCNNYIGNLYNDNLIDIVTYENIQKLKTKILITSYRYCEKCFIKNICNKGCPGKEDKDTSELSYECDFRRYVALAKAKK